MNPVDRILSQPGYDDTQIRCPSCASTQVHAEKRGFSLAVGVIGMNKIKLTCLKCGCQFDTPKQRKYRSPEQRAENGLFIIAAAVIVVVLVIVNLVK